MLEGRWSLQPVAERVEGDPGRRRLESRVEVGNLGLAQQGEYSCRLRSVATGATSASHITSVRIFTPGQVANTKHQNYLSC